MSRSSQLILGAVAIAIATVSVLYFWPGAAQQNGKGPNRIIITNLPSRGGVAEPPTSSNDKTMTMVFTKSKREYSGLWTYLVFAEAFKRMGMELVFENYPPERCSFLSDHGKVDGELSRAHSYNRTHPNLIRVEEPLSSITWMAYSIDPAIHIDGWEGLQGVDYKVEYRKGLVEAEYRLYELLKEENVSTVNSVSQGLRKLAAGRTDVYVDIEETVTPYLMGEEFASTQIHGAGLLEEISLHAFFHKKNESHAPTLSGILKEMKDDGSFDRFILDAERELGAPTAMGQLLNAGFEEADNASPKHWEFSGSEGGLLLDRDICVEGQYSVQILLQQHSSEGVRLRQEVEVEAGHRYDLGGSIKTGLQDGFAEISATFLNKAGNEIETISLQKVVGDNPWVHRNLWVKSPNGADTARIVCVVQGSGQAWFDDIHFTPKLRGGY